jgi:hypothetical protein
VVNYFPPSPPSPPRVLKRRRREALGNATNRYPE